ncbi:MAG TPA: metallophosphoesterase [Anaerolineaceae bacterium]|nr:metallophosphoesterase [Anaerolineaceae bacterium]
MKKIILIFSIKVLLLMAGCVADNEKLYPVVTPAVLTFTPGPTLTESPSETFTATLTKTLTPVPATPTPTQTNTPVYFSGAGDISICGQDGDNLTADLLLNMVGSGLYFVAGDASNENGSLYEYQNCFGPSWGQLMPDLRVVPGNHDYYSDTLQNFWVYFDGVAGEPGKGWYSFEHGEWHIVMLNSNCGYVGCGPSSEQVAWLKQDLAENQSICSMAIWHHPRFNSGFAGNAHWLHSFWEVLHEFGADVVVSGHDHHYERLAKVDPAGNLDETGGIRSFIVGTGGVGFYAIDKILPISDVRITRQFGIIQFKFFPDGYSWEFINVDGEVLDQGADQCNPKPVQVNAD